MALPDFTLAHWKRAVGFVLRSLRHKAGFSQEEVAAQVGMDRAHLARWERGRYEPGSYRFLRLLMFYGCTVGNCLERVADRAQFYLENERRWKNRR